MQRSGSRSVFLLLAVASVTCAPLSAQSDIAPAIVLLADDLARDGLWPGFEPRRTPVAIFDGTRTWLFRHPAPPSGFIRVSASELPARLADGETWIFPDRHPAVVANTSVELAGHLTATLVASDERPARERAGTLIHEAFHVFQRRHHPGWSANEADLFTYPAADPDVVLGARLEIEALRRALNGPGDDLRACWARVAMGERARRFAALPEAAREYERKTELNEGLASYIEHLATGAAADADVLPADPFAPEAVRQRGYRTGLALARLLDRLHPGWKTQLRGEASVDGLLSSALAANTSPANACGFGADERRKMEQAARADAEAVTTGRVAARDAFLTRPGWRLVIEAPEGGPLFPQGFDPLNVRTLGEGAVLHARYLKLGAESATIEVMGRECLTEAAGLHPLFGGVRRLVVTGLVQPPSIAHEGEGVTIEAEGVTAALPIAAVERNGHAVIVRLR